MSKIISEALKVPSKEVDLFFEKIVGPAYSRKRMT